MWITKSVKTDYHCGLIQLTFTKGQRENVGVVLRQLISPDFDERKLYVNKRLAKIFDDELGYKRTN